LPSGCMPKSRTFLNGSPLILHLLIVILITCN
jgi:hypothetical protein